MKKILAAILCLAMMLSLGVSAGATAYAFLTACCGVLALASALSGLPVGKVPGSVTALRLTARALLAAAGILFISPGLVTDGIALALIAAQALVSRVLLRRPDPA